jgi:hypothetical protein
VNLFSCCRVATEFVKSKEEELEGKHVDADRASVLEEYLRNPALDRKDVISMISDALFAGIDTVSTES